MKKTYRLRVDLSPLNWMRAQGALTPVLDMLRYSGLLDSNVQGFPTFIEYEVPHDPKGIIDRWASFGIRAVEVTR